MSGQAYPMIDGWLGYGKGAEILLRTGVPLAADHPAVAERPELFASQPAPAAADAEAQARRIADLEARLEQVTALLEAASQSTLAKKAAPAKAATAKAGANG